MKKLFRSIDLQMFADGAGSASDGGFVGNDAGENITAPSTQGQNSGDNGEKGTENAENTQAAAEPTNEGGESFEELINGKFKEEYDKNVGKIINRRLSALRQENATQRGILDTLMARFNVSSIEELNEVVNSDEEIRNAAANEGMEVEAYKQIEELRKFKRQQAETERLNQAVKLAQEQENIWREEARKVQEVFPEFNLDDELQNADFRALIKNKNSQYQISMLDAYRIVHAEDIAKNIEKAAYEKFSKSVNVRAQRPAENGSGASPRAEVKGVSSLTKKERADLAKRAMQGERITF